MKKYNKREIDICKLVINILIVLIFVAGSSTITHTCAKVVDTAVSLIILNDNAQFYNEQPRKTDSMTEDYIENNKLRQEFYNSEDTVIRVYSNMNILLKLFFLFVAVVLLFAIPLLWVYCMFAIVCRFLYKSQARKRKAQKSRR